MDDDQRFQIAQSMAKNINEPEPDALLRLLYYELEQMNDEVERIAMLLDGDETRDVVGLRLRLKTLEGIVAELKRERTAKDNRDKGIVIGLGLTALTSGGTLATVLGFI